MTIPYRVSTLLCAHLLVIAGTLKSPPVFAQTDFIGCEGLTGPGAGLCKAAMALDCDPSNSDGACSRVSQRYESLTGAAAPWLDGRGPEITCSDPIDGAILDQTPGGQISLQGIVSDASGVNEFLVNGSPVFVDPSGNFSTEISADWGINFIELAATDFASNQTRRTCTFLLSDTWVPDGDTLASSISFKAGQAVIDDSNRSDGLDSLADIFYSVFNSPGLRNELHSALSLANPLKPDACDAELIVCVLRSEVLYQNISMPGPNTTQLHLVSDGLANSTRVKDLGVRVRVRGHVAGIPYDTTGWITYDHVTVDATNDVGLSAGQPNVSVRPGSVSVSVGTIHTSFDGLDGAVINIVTDLFNGPIRDLVVNLARNYVNDNLNDILDSVLGSLDVHNLANNFNVPLLDDASAVGISFGTAFSTISVTANRMLASLGTQFQTIPTHARLTLGAAIPPGSGALDITTSQPLAVAVQDGVINQVLHALWHAGYFDASLVGGDLSGLVPPDVSLQLTVMLPPVARLRGDGRLEIALGAVLTHLEYPALLAEPIEPSLAARGSCAPSLLGDDLVLDQCLIEELHLSLASEAIDANTLTSLELFFTDIVNQVLLTVVNDSLPALPIPGVILPSSLSMLGLPGGSEMRLLDPQLSVVGDYAVLDGQFGVR